MTRCGWADGDPLMERYHDEEWGVPLHDDRRLYEFLVLDAMQAGLSWATVLRKRSALSSAFAGFDIEVVSKYGEEDIGRLLMDAGIIRNRRKIVAAVENAGRFIEVQREFGTFDRYIWQFVAGRPIVHHFNSMSELPAVSEESVAMSRDLRRRGFSFVGPTICYAFMQAAGMVNDHLTGCFRYLQVQA